MAEQPPFARPAAGEDAQAPRPAAHPDEARRGLLWRLPRGWTLVLLVLAAWGVLALAILAIYGLFRPHVP